MMIEQWLSNESTTPKPYVEQGSIRDRPNAGGAGDLVGFLHAGRIATQTRAHLIVAGVSTGCRRGVGLGGVGSVSFLQRGFHVCQGLPSRNFDMLPSRNFDRQEPTKNDQKLFKKHYGSDLAVLARMWHDMGETILLETGRPIIADNKDKTERVGPRGRDSCSVPGVTFLN
jgi:hypothetical protein